jgi:hypothetical protein
VHRQSAIQFLPASKFCFILLATKPCRWAIAALTLHQGQSCKSRGKVVKAAMLAAAAAWLSALASSTASTTSTASAGTFAARPPPLLFGSTATVTYATFAFCLWLCCYFSLFALVLPMPLLFAFALALLLLLPSPLLLLFACFCNSDGTPPLPSLVLFCRSW